MSTEPVELLRRRAALAWGRSDNQLRRLYTHDGWRRLGRGTYVPDGRFADLDQVTQHRVRIAAMRPALTDAAVFSYESAAVLLGLPLWRVPPGPVHVTRNRCNGGRIKDDLKVHSAATSEVVIVDGVAVTTPERTIVDLGRTLPIEPAVVAGDAAMRWFGVTMVELRTELELAKRRRGIADARRVVALLDPRSESVGESRSRLMFARCGVTGMAAQGDVFDGCGEFLGRVDFYDPELGVLGEFDGRVKYGRELAGATAEDAVYREKLREDRMRDHGFVMVRWTWAELSSDEVARRIERARERARRAGPPDGRIVPAALPDPRPLERRPL